METLRYALRVFVPALVVVAGLSVQPASGAVARDAKGHHVPCRVRFAERYCSALDQRHAIRSLRRLEAVQVHRTHARFKVVTRRLSWNLARLKAANLWERSRLVALRRLPTWHPALASASPLYAAFMCIHRGEGAWNANTGNGFHGGLQMDDSFQRSYGPEFYARWGGAENWPPWAQLLAAYRAHASRGFAPWPMTARACGLL